MKLTDKIAEIAKPAAEKFGCELWDVEFAREGGQRFLRVFIDKEGGVGIEDCEKVSRELDPLLDELDLIEESYTFEVSSAGLERPLKRPSDFEKFIGAKIFISLYFLFSCHFTCIFVESICCFSFVLFHYLIFHYT